MIKRLRKETIKQKTDLKKKYKAKLEKLETERRKKDVGKMAREGCTRQDKILSGI